MGGHGHPYSPAELDLPGFVPQRLSQVEVVAPFVGTSLLLVLSVWLISGRCRGGRLSKTDRLAMCWWAFIGVTHIVFVGPLVFTPDFVSKKNPNYFDDLFKEFSKGDSRYAARNTAVLAYEAIMVGLIGPAALLAVYASASMKSYSHILEFAIGLVQVYGILFYFVTAYLAGFNFWASSFYFWVYFIGANSPWVVMPLFIVTRSWKKISEAFGAKKVKAR
ncbi:hypothetical protein HU200_021008 [Digitaria exilis]|uniref:EXPERA domain-containing protein n=1 Tax=Digitaria exilis TaxID=1010633 RepID=A0A835EZU3_9POAL|nr:hypothetical protein HU200_021008 [Digitaria exilis]